MVKKVKLRKAKKFTTKSVQQLMEKRLTTQEIAEIERQAELEAKFLKSIEKA